MRRLTALACAAVAGAGCLVPATVLAGSAAAANPVLTPGAAGYAAAGDTGSAQLSPSIALSGALGGLIDALISPIVTQDLNPLAAGLRSITNGAVAATLGSSSSLNAATNPSQTQVSTAPGTFPTETFPSPCTATGPQPCYSGTSTSVAIDPLTSTSVGAMSGFAEQVMSSADATNPVFGRSRIASVSVSALPAVASLVPALGSAVNPVVTASTVDAEANCPNDGAAGATKPVTAPSASVSTGTVQLLGGLVKFDVLSNQIADLVVNGTSYTGLATLPTVTASGVTISPFGSTVLVTIPLSVTQVLQASGIPASVISALNAFPASSTVNLRLAVGPNVAVTNTTAKAWGLGIGVDLSGSLSFNLLNLATATVTLPSGIGGGNTGNLLDLHLGYATCQSGSKPTTTGPAAVPAALV